MAGRRSTKKNHRSRSAKARRRVLGLGTGRSGVGVGRSPLANAPAAHADVLDAILDPLINSLGNVDPTLAGDLGSLVTSFDPTFSDPGLAALPAADAALPAADSAQSTHLTQLYNTYFYTPTQEAEQAWINSSFGETVDNSLNTFWQELTGQTSILIGNGADGTSAADPRRCRRAGLR